MIMIQTKRSERKARDEEERAREVMARSGVKVLC